MYEKPVWKQESAHHFALLQGEQRVDVCYEQAGFQSGWAIYIGSSLIDRCTEFMQARGVALNLASGRA